ncbi:hypothetical protein DW060_04175 [Leyella stercorea]|uniref:Uncharacterized protein n=1 Tax=Leyella stercorea TaxID=363265 RepID=A0A415GP40_9BACT|nr:hypothetical protein DW060_04175 [Leyella stercorea]
MVKDGLKAQLSHSPGQRLGKHYTPHFHTPCKGKSLIIKVLPFQGALLIIYKQYPGAALGYVNVGLTARIVNRQINFRSKSLNNDQMELVL